MKKTASFITDVGTLGLFVSLFFFFVGTHQRRQHSKRLSVNPIKSFHESESIYEYTLSEKKTYSVIIDLTLRNVPSGISSFKNTHANCSLHFSALIHAQ